MSKGGLELLSADIGTVLDGTVACRPRYDLKKLDANYLETWDETHQLQETTINAI
jgi:hypothetical protein